MGKPAILYLIDYRAPYGGNFIASMARLDEALSARGVRTLYTFPSDAAGRDWYRALEMRGMRLVPLNNGGTAARARQLLRLIDENGVTILHVHFGLFPLAETVALLRPRLRLILHFHSDFSAGRAPTMRTRLRDGCKRVVEALLGRRRIKKITVSERSARTTSDCICLHNALVEERFTKELWTREQTRAEHDVPDGATLVLAFCWSPMIKGADVAVKAVQQLISMGHTQFVLGLVCGREYTKERMQAFISENTDCTGDEPWLRLLPPVEDVFRYHKAADIMLSGSRSETFSYALLEAVATGRFCAASDIPGVQWARIFDTVQFFPSQDEQALADALLMLDVRRKRADAMQTLAEASARARREFAISEWVAGLLEIYGVG